MSQQGRLRDRESSLETLTGNTGGPVPPDAAGNINVVGTPPFEVSGNPGTNTLTIDQDGTIAITYTEDSGTATASSGNLNVFGDATQGAVTSGAGDTITITNSDASTTQKGVLETSTNAESIAGTSTVVAVTPGSLTAKLGIQTANSVPYGTGTSSAIAWTSALTDGQLVIGATGAPPAAASVISSDGSITITVGANSLDLEVDGGTTVGKTITGDTGGALSPTAGNWNIVGGTVSAGSTPMATAGSGSTLTINAQISQALASTDATSIGLSNFDSAMFSVDANGFVQLAGGGQAMDSIAVQATSGTGTDPILPTSAGLVTIDGAIVSAQSIPVQSLSPSPNTMQIEVQRSSATASTDTTSQGLSSFDSGAFSVDANGYVTLPGGGTAIESVGVQATSGTGTDPVVPDSSGAITVDGAGVGAQSILVQSLSSSPNTYQIEVQRASSSTGTDTTSQGLASFDDTAFSVDANGYVTLVGSGPVVDSFLPDTGTSPVVPDGSGQVSILGQSTPSTSGIQVTGGTNKLDISMFSPFVGDFTFTDSTPGNTEILTVSNTDDTAANASGARLALSVGGDTQIGDPYVSWNVASDYAYSAGIDTTDAENFKITYAATASTVTPSTGTTFFEYDTAADDINLIATNTFSTFSGTGINVGFGAINTETANSGSSAVVASGVEATTAGDPFFQLGILTATTNKFGLDNSDSDKFKYLVGSDAGVSGLDGTETIVMTQAGEITYPTQPAFLAVLTTNRSNVTGTGTIYTIIFNSEVFDQNADFNLGTSTFTAPVTGRYQFDGRGTITGTTVMTTSELIMTTSNREYRSFKQFAALAGSYTNEISQLTDMDAADTAVLKIATGGEGADTDDVLGTSQNYTAFSGFLSC